MLVGTTTGTNKEHRKEALGCGVLEVLEPSAVAAVAGAATLNQGAGFVTSEALTTAAGANYTLTLTNSFIDANTLVIASVSYGSAVGATTQGTPTVCQVLPAAGSATIVVRNVDGANAFNGTIVIGFFLVRKAPVAL
jgi:hypothetical protein